MICISCFSAVSVEPQTDPLDLGTGQLEVETEAESPGTVVESLTLVSPSADVTRAMKQEDEYSEEIDFALLVTSVKVEPNFEDSSVEPMQIKEEVQEDNSN